MHLLLLGLNHRHASVDVRARVASAIVDIRRWLEAVAGGRTVSELMVLSTCHRLEFYAVADDADLARAQLREWVTEGHDTPDDAFVELSGGDAALHLCRVAAGLDSLIVGEAEIAGQVRRAATAAREAGTLGPYLERIIAGALAASGRARSETRIGDGVLSAASAGVALAARALGSFAGRHVLVVGAGQAGRSVVARLARRPIGRVSVASRSAHHASAAAATIGADVWSLEDVPARLGEVDAVIAALTTERAIVTTSSVRAARAALPNRSSVFVDLSLPRAVEPGVADLPGVVLYSVDDLGDIARRSLRRREREIPAVEEIARGEAARALERVEARRSYDRRLSRCP